MRESDPGARGAKSPVYSSILLALVVTIIFAVAAFPQPMHEVLYDILFTLIMVMAAFSIDRGRGLIIKMAVVPILLQWVAAFLDMKLLFMLSRIFIFLFFILIVLGLITQIARTKRVTARVIIESINGYLLLGFVFALIAIVIANIHPEAFSIPAMDPGLGGAEHSQSDLIYYAFVTYTTLGYGDLLPLAPYSKSIAVLTAVCGQIYLTVLVAMLVGKFLSHSHDG
jgi:voltage-gated potassium channel